VGKETNRSRRQNQAASAREKAAAARAEQQRLGQRRRALAIISGIVVLAVIGVVVAVVAINHKGKSGPATAASATVLNQVTSVPASVQKAIGAGTAVTAGLPESIQGGQSISSGGKPTLLYIGAEFCPFCAGERWALIQALSRFGTFSGLKQIHSAEDNIATFTFLNATYTSSYLNFDPREQEDQNAKPLQNLTAVENAQFSKYLAPGQGSPGYPFLYFDGKYVSIAGPVDPSVLLGKSWSQISSSLSNPSSPIAKSVVGAANHIAAAICTLTGDKPAGACPANIQALSKSFTAYGAA